MSNIPIAQPRLTRPSDGAFTPDPGVADMAVTENVKAQIGKLQDKQIAIPRL